MSRALRVQYEGAYYHVACRGNERHNIFRDDSDRFAFLECLERSAEIYDARVLCYEGNGVKSLILNNVSDSAML